MLSLSVSLSENWSTDPFSGVPQISFLYYSCCLFMSFEDSGLSPFKYFRIKIISLNKTWETFPNWQLFLYEVHENETNVCLIHDKVNYFFLEKVRLCSHPPALVHILAGCVVTTASPLPELSRAAHLHTILLNSLASGQLQGRAHLGCGIGGGLEYWVLVTVPCSNSCKRSWVESEGCSEYFT